jgi:hypothetical protein
MKLHLVPLLAILCAPPLGAGTILDVGGQPDIMLHTGDSLAFEIQGGSFSRNALAFGLPRDPEQVSFALISMALSGALPGAGVFSASLRSADGTVSVDFAGPLTFHEGSFSAAGYQGPVSTLQGYLQLSPLLSQELFGRAPAVLTLRNEGPDLTLGLEPYTLRQDLFISLGGGPMSVGGIVGSAKLESGSAFRPAVLGSTPNPNAVGNSGTPDSVSLSPEPGSSGLFLAGGALLCGVSVALSRISKRHK